LTEESLIFITGANTCETGISPIPGTSTSV